VQPVLDAPLAVDELHDADDLAARVDHRDGQDGARLVARLFVEGAIVTETPGVVARSRRGELVRVRDVDDLARDDAAADDRAGIDRQRELREVELGAVILRDFETKRALRYVFVLPLDDVDRSRVGICNISAFFQYQREQLVDVALRRQGAADRVDLVDLRLVSVREHLAVGGRPSQAAELPQVVEVDDEALDPDGGADGRDLAVLEEGVGARVAEVRVAPDEHHGRIPGARSAQVRLDLAAVAPDRRPRGYRTAGDEGRLSVPRTLRSQIAGARA